MTYLGRPLPTADIGYEVAQFEGQPCGGGIAYLAVAGRPTADIGARALVALKLPLKGQIKSRRWTGGRGLLAAHNGAFNSGPGAGHLSIAIGVAA